MPSHDTASLVAEPIVARVRAIQAAMRDALRRHMLEQEPAVWSRTERDDAGDTIFGIDAAIETTLLEHCAAWGESQHFTLLAEGLPPEGVEFGKAGRGGPPFRLLVDPIDGTRGLMFDKRSAWSLAGVAPDRGAATRLEDVQIAVMTELPTTRQASADVLWAVVKGGARGERIDLRSGAARPIAVVPSQATSLRHGFATVSAFFQGGKELLARLDEAILQRVVGSWNPEKAEVYTDQYICSGGQLAEVALGRDRFVMDVRPMLHRKLGVTSSLACRPYDLAAWLVAAEAGCVVRDPLGAPLRAPLDVTTNVGFACYANAQLAERMIPIVRDEVLRHLG